MKTFCGSDLFLVNYLWIGLFLHFMNINNAFYTFHSTPFVQASNPYPKIQQTVVEKVYILDSDISRVTR